jgi:hypothetical protein
MPAPTCAHGDDGLVDTSTSTHDVIANSGAQFGERVIAVSQRGGGAALPGAGPASGLVRSSW